MFQRKKLGAPVQRGSVTSRVVKLFNDLTRQDHLGKPKHIGMFAGSLLERNLWDHK